MNNPYLNEITGPVIPLPTPFNADESVDHESLHNYVTFLVDNGIKNIMTTVGTSRYNLLTNEEVKAVNETVVKAAAGKAKTIVANPPFGGQMHALEFAKHAEEIGADLYLAYFPDRNYGENDILNFFQELSDAINIGILIHEMPLRNGLGGGAVQYSVPLLKKLLQIKNVVGVKEEALDIAHSNAVVRAISSEAVIIGAGGGMSRYLRDYWLGAKAFLGGIGNFAPQVELDFYQLFENKEFEKAYQLVEEVELPFFQDVVPFGWHPSLKGMLHLCGHMQEFERRPLKQNSKEELNQLKATLQKNNWL
ncbi:MAG: dihydrodipicolinate synthase family protein [Vicingaceae bacterium]